MEVKGAIVCKKSDNKAFKMGDDWYNVNDNVVADLERLNKTDVVTVTFEKKGTSRYVSKLVKAGSAPTQEAEQEQSGEFKCEVCGKVLKDGKFKKCYTCNKSGAVKKEDSTQSAEVSSGPTCIDCGKALKDSKYKKCFACNKTNPEKKSNSYDSPEKTAQIQRGNALNAAGAGASGQQFENPEQAIEFILTVADACLLWLRAE